MLKELETITDTYVLPELAECEFKIACDVTNPLCGENGCSAVYGRSKGANPSMIMEMDKWLRYYAALAREKFPKANPNEPGTGAAGGLGFAFLTFTNAVLESGIKIVLEETKLESYVKGADVVVTGEGRLDFQTAMGKAPVGVAGLAKKFDIPGTGLCRQCDKRCHRMQQKRHRCLLPDSFAVHRQHWKKPWNLKMPNRT